MLPASYDMPHAGGLRHEEGSAASTLAFRREGPSGDPGDCHQGRKGAPALSHPPAAKRYSHAVLHIWNNWSPQGGHALPWQSHCKRGRQQLRPQRSARHVPEKLCLAKVVAARSEESCPNVFAGWTRLHCGLQGTGISHTCRSHTYMSG